MRSADADSLSEREPLSVCIFFAGLAKMATPFRAARVPVTIVEWFAYFERIENPGRTHSCGQLNIGQGDLRGGRTATVRPSETRMTCSRDLLMTDKESVLSATKIFVMIGNDCS